MSATGRGAGVMDKTKSLVPLTESCRIAVGRLGAGDRCLLFEVKQRGVGDDDVTTLLLSSERARELAGVLLRHAGAREEAG